MIVENFEELCLMLHVSGSLERSENHNFAVDRNGSVVNSGYEIPTHCIRNSDGNSSIPPMVEGIDYQLKFGNDDPIPTHFICAAPADNEE